MAFALLAVTLGSMGCHANQAVVGNTRYKPFKGLDLSLSVPDTYTQSEVWSPDSDTVKFVHPDRQTVVYFELGPSGYPDYSDKQGYSSSEITINDIVGEIVRFSDNPKQPVNTTLILRFAEPNSTRVWANCRPDHIEEIEAILRSFRWYTE
ncbi:MAG: hypothetical protein KTR15_09695 [Phycisphaeraceae bacterium]|nr:hypothetical protein [Phycisphaeraceae bacterium]